MSSSEDESDFSESEFDDRAERAYEKLKKEKAVQHNPRNGTWRCPYCKGKKKSDYKFKDLLQHATGVAKSHKKLKESANHRALEKYLRTDVGEVAEVVPMEVDSPKTDDHRKGNDGDEDRFVWPLMVILANIQCVGKEESVVDTTESKLRQLLAAYEPVKVTFLNSGGFNGKAVVEFDRNLMGFHHSKTLAMSFELDRHGKEDYLKGKGVNLSGLYGWSARYDDYNSADVQIRDHLHECGVLKTIMEIQNDAEKEEESFVRNLAKEMDAGSESLHLSEMKKSEVEYKLKQVRRAQKQNSRERADLIDKHKKDLKKIHDDYHIKRVEAFYEIQSHDRRLHEEREKVALREKELEHREAQTDYDRKKLDEEKKKNDANKKRLQAAAAAGKSAEEKLMKLMKKQMEEKKTTSERIIKMDNWLDTKQMLELEILGLKEKLYKLEKIEPGKVDQEALDSLKQELKDKQESLETTLSMNVAVLSREEQFNKAHEAIIQGFEKIFNPTAQKNMILVIKTMGGLNLKTFNDAWKKKFGPAEFKLKGKQLHSTWEAQLKDTSWKPYRTVESAKGPQQVVDEDDEKLEALKEEWGDEIYNAVVTALKERMEYNSSGKVDVKEIWNTKENRKASLQEAVEYMVKHCKK